MWAMTAAKKNTLPHCIILTNTCLNPVLYHSLHKFAQYSRQTYCCFLYLTTIWVSCLITDISQVPWMTQTISRSWLLGNSIHRISQNSWTNTLGSQILVHIIFVGHL